MSKPAWKGVYPALTTQYREDQSLDLDATAKHIERLIEGGIDGLIVLGTVGENTSHEYREKLDVIRAALDAVRKRIPVLTGVAECTTPLACRFAADAEKLGVDGLMLLPPMVYKTAPHETIAYFRAVAQSTPLPIMCYNNPVAYGTDITPEMFADLADEPNLAAIKESSEDVRRITDLSNLLGGRYILFSGVDDLALESALLGAEGWVSGLVNAFPEEACALWNLAAEGDWERARSIYRWFTPLLHLDTDPRLVQYIKLAAAACGLGSETVRAPRLAVQGADRDRIVKLVQQAIETRPALPAPA